MNQLDGELIQRKLQKHLGRTLCKFMFSLAKDIPSAESNLGPLQIHLQSKHHFTKLAGPG